MLNTSQVQRVYSGKEGCMCGCKGTYYEEGNRMVKKVVRLINEHPEIADWKNEGWVKVTVNDRVYVAYLKEEVRS